MGRNGKFRGMIGDEGYILFEGDCLDVLSTLKDSSVDLICIDPPYFKVKNLAWDRQWAKPKDFLEWMGIVLEEFHRALKPNGSLYVFASPKMSWGVEGEVRKKFCVLNNIRWVKPHGRSNAASKESLRSFFPEQESIIFAEHFGADNIAKGEAGYEKKCDELRGFVFEPRRAYLISERKKAGLSRTDIRNAYSKSFGNKGAGITGHYWDRSQWMLPTEDMYNWLRKTLSRLNSNGQYLRREYEELRREYEELRREYEELRRPFGVSKDVPYTDVWTFKTVQSYKGKHPCEKPYDLIEHIIRASSREGATVLDAFMGSGVTGEACIRNNRKFIGIDMQSKWVKKSQNRIEAARINMNQLTLI